MNIHPLVRVDKKEYLEDLQKGNLFLRSNLYYQKMDCDKERGDIYDGAIYGDWFNPILPKDMQQSKILNPRIVMGNLFIKSFFQYVDEEVEKVGEKAYRYLLSKKSQEVLTQFKDADSVMIILDTAEFIKQFEDACNSKKIQFWFDSIHYMDENDIRNLQQMYLNLEKQSKLLNPVFVKRKGYSNQQEFRLCVQHPISKEIDEAMEEQGVVCFEKSVVDVPYEINIGQIEDYSVIIPLKEFMGHSISIDFKRHLFSISD